MTVLEEHPDSSVRRKMLTRETQRNSGRNALGVDLAFVDLTCVEVELDISRMYLGVGFKSDNSIG